MKKIRLRVLIMQISFIMVLLSVFSISIFLLLYKPNNDYSNITPYEFIEKTKTVQTGKIQRSDVVKYISLTGMVNRINSEVKEIHLPKSSELACTIGSIIYNGKDISPNNETDNYFQGRVIDILITEQEYIVKIDIATNYYIYTFLNDNYASYILDLQTGNMDVVVQNNYRLLMVSLPIIEYNCSTAQYRLCFQLNQIDEYTFSQMIVRLRVKDTMYKGVTYVDASIIKEINGKNIVLDKINILDNNYYTEKITFTVLDIVDEKIIIDADEYLADSFVLFNRYKANEIK